MKNMDKSNESCAYTSQLQDKDDNARKEAVKALGELADPRAIEPLIAILKDWKVQTETVQALVKIGEPAIDPLIEVLKDENWRIRKGFVQALGEIGVPRAVAPLLGALKDHDSDVQKEAVRALGKIGEPAIALLLAALKNEDDDVQKGAMQALEEIGEPAVDSLLEWLVDLKRRGETQQVEQLLVNLWNLREFDQQQAIAVGLTENELMKALGQSTGAYAQELMEAALSKACQGQSSESVALANSGTHRAMVLSDVSISLADGLKATTPGDLYYAICLTERIRNLDKCKYTADLGAIGGTAAGYIVPQQVIWDIEKREVRTGKKVDSTTLRGNAPSCPAFASFGTKGETQYRKGTPPSVTEAIGWIKKTLKIPEKTIESQKAIEPLPETVWTKASIGLYSDSEGKQAVALIGQKSKLTVLAEQGEWRTLGFEIRELSDGERKAKIVVFFDNFERDSVKDFFIQRKDD